MKRFFSTAAAFKLVFALAIFLLLFISGLLYRQILTQQESEQRMVHSYKVHLELEHLLSYLKDAETSQRGYLISERANYLPGYKKALKRVELSYARLSKLTGSQVRYQEDMATLKELVALRSYYLEYVLQNSLEPRFKADSLEFYMTKGRYAMDGVRVTMNKLINNEIDTLNQIEQAHRNHITLTPIAGLSLVLFALFIFGAAYYKINRDVVVLNKLNQKLRLAKEQFEHAEEIGNISSWSWNLATNRLVYSDNQYQLLGCEPKEFEPTVENFLAFVHPDDRDIILNDGERVLREKTPSEANFRVIRKDGSLRYFRSIGKLVGDGTDHKTIIGINADITEEHEKKRILDERNRDLERTNAELASFNHVSSHDLQEPLRKIQMFISRISDYELNTLSETGKDYFQKIRNSANRMQLLIDDLLMFSRASKAEKVFELADLNLLFQRAKAELAPDAEQLNATITSSWLPTLTVIPYQIQQLLINLIGNALKYRRNGVAPVIQLTYNRKPGHPDLHEGLSASEHYHFFSLSDNGLGFDQEYAQNIFVLFHRLHHKGDYPGTGIGLSICKKIVENHNGFIFAKGHTGVGSVFTFCLPVE